MPIPETKLNERERAYQQQERARLLLMAHDRLTPEMREFFSVKYEQLLVAETPDPLIELMRMVMDEFNVSMVEANRAVTAWTSL